jgi:hypothetical protein
MTMLPYDPDSISELLRAKYIFLAVFDSIAFGPWAPDGEMLESRVGEAQVRIGRVLKGEIETAEEAALSISLKTWRKAGPRFVAVPGVWSKCQIAPGAAFVVFSRACGGGLAALLVEPCAFAACPADAALSEVELILELATPETRLPDLVTALTARPEILTTLSARYVAARLRELLFGDLAGFNRVLSEAENPKAPAIFRRIVISEAYDDLMMLDPAGPAFIARLIWGSVRMFGSGTAPDFASRVLETYIPNLLGLEGGLARKNASGVFAEVKEQRQEMAAILRGNTQLPGRERLLAWVES